MPAFSPDVERVREAILQLMEERHIPGVGLGIVAGGEVVHAEGLGSADIAAGRPYAPDTRHRIASVSKTMVGLCVMALVDEGRLSLEDRVPDLLPDITFHGEADTLTVWHLMTHSGGIGEAPNPDDMKQPFGKLFGESDPSLSLVELYAKGVTIEVPPGSKWAYANHGFVLLGEIVARKEGAPLPDAIARRVFEPLGMRSSDLSDEPHPDMAQGYSQALTPEARQVLDFFGTQLESEEPVDGYNLPGKFIRTWGNGGAGGVQSTITDMTAYACALLQESRGIVRPETFRLMTSDQFRPDRRLPGWGLSFGVHERAGHRGFGHGGSYMGGWNSHLAVYPELNAALVFHTNLWQAGFDGMIPYFMNPFLGIDGDAPQGIALDPQVLETAPGVYELRGNYPLTDFRPRSDHGRLLVRREGDGLMLFSRRGAWREGGRLLPADANDPELFNAVVAGHPPVPVVLARAEGGDVASIRLPTRAELFRNTELAPWEVPSG